MVPEHLRTVPWVGQRFSGAWPDGAGPAGGPAYWGPRACGIACAAALLTFHGRRTPTRHELLAEAVEHAAYTPAGWSHAGLARLLERHGLPAQARLVADPADLVAIASAGRPSIVSVTLGFPEDGQKGGHLVVFAGHLDGGHLARFMDPSRWGRDHWLLPSSRFWASWTGRAILAGPPR